MADCPLTTVQCFILWFDQPPSEGILGQATDGRLNLNFHKVSSHIARVKPAGVYVCTSPESVLFHVLNI